MLYALDRNVERLADDHARARRLAEGLHAAGLPVDLDAVETNFVGLEHDPLGLSEEEAVGLLRARGILVGHLRPGVLRRASRTSTSRTAMIEQAVELIPEALGAGVRA